MVVVLTTVIDGVVSESGLLNQDLFRWNHFCNRSLYQPLVVTVSFKSCPSIPMFKVVTAVAATNSNPRTLESELCTHQ